jgi:Dynamin family
MTVTNDNMTLTEKIIDARERAHAQAGTAVAGLIKIADWLDLSGTSDILAQIASLLDSYIFQLIMMGRMKVGKSTLLNALLEGTSQPVAISSGRGLMAVGTLPTTAVLTTVRYADKPSVKVQRMDGTSADWKFDQYLRDSVLSADNDENVRFFEQIKEFQIGFPAVLCQAGVVVVDSPGTDEHPMRTRITRAAARQADAAIRPYRSDVLMGEKELEEDAEVRNAGTRVFTVVNVWGDNQVDDRMRAYIWNRYVRDHLGGPKWDHQDLSEYDIFVVHAQQAFAARGAGDATGVERSGLGALERRLAEFLTTERLPAHLHKHATSAIQQADVISEHIGQREAAARADQRQLQDAFAAEQPKIAQILARADKLPAIFARYRAQADLELRASFRQAVADIRRDLPQHLESETLPSAQNLAKVFQHKKMTSEAAAAISEFTTDRLDKWNREEASALLEPIMKRLGDEVKAEVAAIGEQLDEIHFRMSGWTVPADGNARLVSTTERVLAAVAGLFFGDVSAAVTGGAGGWRGAAGGISGALGASLLLGALGVTAGIVFWPATLAAALVAGAYTGGQGLEKRVKKVALETADVSLAALPDASSGPISAKTAEFFSQAEQEVSAEVKGFITEQVRSIQQFVELNQRDQADKDRILMAMAKARSAVAEHVETLERAVAIARQG